MEEEKQIDSTQTLEESNFKIKFTRLTNYADYEESYCDVCFQRNDKYFPNDEERGTKMMVCYGCNVKCHSYCYGIDTHTQEEAIKNKPNQKVLYFLCQKCRVEPKKQLACAVCNSKKGAIKKIENSSTNEWVHITCGFYNGGIIKVDNYRNMSFVKQSSHPIEKDKKSKKGCHFCKSDVGIMKCSGEDCQQHAHVYCTMRYMNEQELKDKDTGDMEWFVRMNYVNNPHFDMAKGDSQTGDLSKNAYFQESLKHSFNEISHILVGANIFDVQNAAASFLQSSEHLPTEMKQSKIGPARKGRGKRKMSEEIVQTQEQSNQENPSTAAIGDEKESTTQLDNEITKQNKAKYQSKLVEIGNLIMQNFVLNINNNNSNIQQEETKPAPNTPSATKKSTKNQQAASSEMKSEEAEKETHNPEVILRGGEIQLECPEHRKQDVFCVCQKVDSEEDMVFCDLCKEIDEEEFIRLKYLQWRDRLSTRPTIEELEIILDEGRDIPVDCSQEIKKLELEKEEVQIWCQTLEEQERNANSLLSQKLKQEERVINKNLHSSQIQSEQESDSKTKKDVSSSSVSKANAEKAEEKEAIEIEQPIQTEEVSTTEKKEEKIEVEEDPSKVEEKQPENSENEKKEDEVVSENKNSIEEEKQTENKEEEMQLEKAEKAQNNEENENKMQIEENNEKSNISEDKKEQSEQLKIVEQESSVEISKNPFENEISQKIYKNQQLMSKGDFELFAHQMFTKVVLQVPRMKEIIDMLEQYENNEVLWDRLIEFINEKEQENQKKTEEETAQQVFQMMNPYQNNMSKFELIEFSELQSLLDSCLKLEIKVPFLNQIYQQVSIYNDIKNSFQAVLNSQFDEQAYQNALKRIAALPFIFEEEQTFQERILFFNEIQDICKNGFKKFYSIEMLQKISDICTQAKFAENIQTELKSKTEHILSLASGVNKLLESGQFEKEQLEQAKEYLNEMKNVQKVDFNLHIEKIKNIEKSEQFFRTLHKFFYNLTPEMIQLDPSQRVQEIDLELEEILEAKSIEECLSDIQEKWELVESNVASVKAEIYGFIFNQIGETLHPDKRILKVLQNLAEMFWISEANILLNTPALQDFSAVCKVYENLKQRVSPENEVFKKIKALCEEQLRKFQELEQMKQRQLQQQLQQQEALQMQQLEMEKLKQQSMPLEKKKINLVVSDDSDNENDSNTPSSEFDSGVDDEDDDEEDEDDDEDNHEIIDDSDEELQKEIESKKKSVIKGNKKEANKNDAIHIESDISIMDEEESANIEEIEENLDNLSETQKTSYKQLVESGKKWNNEINEVCKTIQGAKNISKGKEQSGNKMDVEGDQYLVNFQQLKNLLQEGYSIIYDILQMKKSVLFMRTKTIRLENIFGIIHKTLVEFNKIKDPEQIDDSVKVSNCIDVSDILIEYKVNLSAPDSEQEKLSFKQMIKSPFKSLHKFSLTYNKQADLSYFIKDTPKEVLSKQTSSQPQKGVKAQQQATSKSAQQQKGKPKGKHPHGSVIELESQENNSENNNNDSKSEKSNQLSGLRQKSSRKKTKPIDSDFVYGADFVKSLVNKDKDEGGHENNKTKQKPATAASVKQTKEVEGKKTQQYQIESQDEDDDNEEDDYDSANLEQKAKPENVNDNDRNQAKEHLKKAIKHNTIFNSSQQNPVKTIENQIFGEFHKSKKKYLEKIEQYSKLFVTLNAYPIVSKKVLAKNFAIVNLDKLIESGDYEKLENSFKQQLLLQQQQQQQMAQQAANNATAGQPQKPQTALQQHQNQQNQNNSLFKTLNSSKEPQIQKKMKVLDPLASLAISQAPSNNSNQQQSNNSASALSMLIQKSDPNKPKEVNKQSNISNFNSNNNQSSNKYKDDFANKRNSQNNKYQNFQQQNNRKRRNQQAAFSDESEGEDYNDKNDFHQQDSSKDIQSDSYNKRNSSKFDDKEDNIKLKTKSTTDSDHKKQQEKESKQSPSHQSSSTYPNEEKSSINKQDIDIIDQIQNAYNSESKIYTFDKTIANQANQGMEVLYNPDDDDDGQGQVGMEEEENIQLMNKQYFDKDDEIQIGISTNAESSQNIGNSASQSTNATSAGYPKGGSHLDATSDMDNLYQQNAITHKSSKDKRENFNNEEDNEMEDEQDEAIPEDSIIRICKCRVKTAKAQPSINTLMFTSEPIKVLKKFPQIDVTKSFDLFSYSEHQQVMSYISKSLKNKSITILKGWLELQNPKQDSERLLQGIQILESKDKVAGFRISGMTFNIFTESQINKSEFKFTAKHFNPDNHVILPFIIYKKTNEPKPSTINQFKIVKFCPNPIPPQSLNEPKKYSNQQVVSPILSENEDEEMLTKRDSIFDDKYNESNQQDSQPNISLKRLQEFDFNSLQQQLLELPTTAPTNENSQNYESKSQGEISNQGLRHLPMQQNAPQQQQQQYGNNMQQGGQYISQQRQQQPPIGMNQQGFPYAPMHHHHPHHPPPPPLPTSIVPAQQNQNYPNNYNLNQTNPHMIMGGNHQQQPLQPNMGALPMNYGYQQSIPSIPPPPPPVLTEQTSLQNSDKIGEISNDRKDNIEPMINEDAQHDNLDINLEGVDLDDLQDMLDKTNQQESSGDQINSNRPSQTNIPPPPPPPQPLQQQHGQQPYLPYNQLQKQPSHPHQIPLNQNMYTPPPPPSQQNSQSDQGSSTQNQNPNIDPNLQQLIISQRSKPVYEMNPSGPIPPPPPFPNQPPQPGQQLPNFQNKAYPNQQQQNIMAPPPPQINSQGQIPPPPPPTQQQMYHGSHSQGGPNQNQQWNQNQSGQGNNPQYHRNQQNKNQQYGGMNNPNSNQYQKGMMNAPPPPIPHSGQMPNQQQQNMPPQGYNNTNMGRYPYNQQHSQNSGVNNPNNSQGNNNNNMNRPQRYQPGQGYGSAQQYNSNSPPSSQSQQQNYNKFQRSNPNNSSQNNSSSNNSSSNNNNNNNNNNSSGNNNNNNSGSKSHQQFKNHFGSRQQAHYQRNNQPYTAHNPVPFIDPAEQPHMQSQHMQQHMHQSDQGHSQHDGMFDERDYP